MPIPNIDQFSFILGAVVAAITLWLLGRVWSWLKGIFKPPSEVSLGQKIAGGLRRLISAVLVLVALAVVGYIVYSVLVKPAP